MLRFHGWVAGVIAMFALALASAASAATLAISTDPFTQSTCRASTLTNHRTEVEPDTFSSGATIVAAFQVGRVYDGGACTIGFATSSNNGASWTSGLLPGITKWAGAGPNDRATDASVAYDARHNVWLVSSLSGISDALQQEFGILPGDRGSLNLLIFTIHNNDWRLSDVQLQPVRSVGVDEVKQIVHRIHELLNLTPLRYGAPTARDMQPKRDARAPDDRLADHHLGIDRDAEIV